MAAGGPQDMIQNVCIQMQVLINVLDKDIADCTRFLNVCAQFTAKQQAWVYVKAIGMTLRSFELCANVMETLQMLTAQDIARVRSTVAMWDTFTNTIFGNPNPWKAADVQNVFTLMPHLRKLVSDITQIGVRRALDIQRQASVQAQAQASVQAQAQARVQAPTLTPAEARAQALVQHPSQTRRQGDVPLKEKYTLVDAKRTGQRSHHPAIPQLLERKPSEIPDEYYEMKEFYYRVLQAIEHFKHFLASNTGFRVSKVSMYGNTIETLIREWVKEMEKHGLHQAMKKEIAEATDIWEAYFINIHNADRKANQNDLELLDKLVNGIDLLMLTCWNNMYPMDNNAEHISRADIPRFFMDVRCNQCHQEGHRTSQCTDRCANCAKPGHNWRRCPEVKRCCGCGVKGHSHTDPGCVLVAEQVDPFDYSRRVCHQCGEVGHDPLQCVKECARCFRSGHTAEKCKNDKRCPDCGFPGHWSGDRLCIMAGPEEMRPADIQGPPVLTAVPASHVVPYGSRVTFTCTANCPVSASVIEYKIFNGDVLCHHGQENTLTIPSLRSVDSGAYTCTVVADDLESTPSNNFILTVSEPTKQHKKIANLLTSQWENVEDGDIPYVTWNDSESFNDQFRQPRSSPQRQHSSSSASDSADSSREDRRSQPQTGQEHDTLVQHAQAVPTFQPGSGARARTSYRVPTGGSLGAAASNSRTSQSGTNSRTSLAASRGPSAASSTTSQSATDNIANAPDTDQDQGLSDAEYARQLCGFLRYEIENLLKIIKNNNKVKLTNSIIRQSINDLQDAWQALKEYGTGANEIRNFQGFEKAFVRMHQYLDGCDLNNRSPEQLRENAYNLMTIGLDMLTSFIWHCQKRWAKFLYSDQPQSWFQQYAFHPFLPPNHMDPFGYSDSVNWVQAYNRKPAGIPIPDGMKPPIKCRRCLEKGHKDIDCTNERKCWKCKRPGHRSYQCLS